MKLLDYLLNGPGADENENFSTNLVTCVTSVPPAPEPKSISKIEQPAAKPRPVPAAVELTGLEMARQVSRWMAMRCAVPKNPARVWASEKSLYRDYGEWCQQSGKPAISLEQFGAILDTSFERDMDGWTGLCLAVDWAATERIQ